MYNEKLEALIDAALADGVLTEKEKEILFKKAKEMGVNLDEFEMVLDARLVKLNSNKLGDVKKCPACGAIVQSYQGVCAECGYAFENIEANSAVDKLIKKLEEVCRLKGKKDIIEKYPIPMEKASLLAFITWLRPQSMDVKNPLANEYFKKYSECVNKIQASFANDKELQPYISYYERDVKKIRTQKTLNLTIKNAWFWILLVLFIILFFILKPTPVHKSAEKSSYAIEKALKKGNTQKAIDIFLKFEDKEYGKYPLVKIGVATSIIKSCLENGNVKDAMNIGNAAGMKYNDPLNEYNAQAALLIYDYCISNGDFETAKIVYHTASSQSYYHGKYIKDVCTYLCKNGKKDEAQKFLNIHIGEIRYDDKLGKSVNYNDDLGKQKEVAKIIQDIIDKY